MLSSLVSFRSNCWAAGAVLAAWLPLTVAASDASTRDHTLSEVELLQDPRKATTFFPKDRDQKPDWVDVLKRRLIEPRAGNRGHPITPVAALMLHCYAMLGLSACRTVPAGNRRSPSPRSGART
jgi:hypothetical protein